MELATVAGVGEWAVAAVPSPTWCRPSGMPTRTKPTKCPAVGGPDVLGAPDIARPPAFR
ncbi:MAG: hypothetical protein AVDCRST_MAG59-868 [uncultured Thermomicrobiales bacterium]|uniref:Uncharacterized protein n=1 Tax=uncultured Thermomicrobiales bacterium TaxID=1645740 RepID=A0A6J4U5E0_9BACT|nr:MAG: hypothetical protein AVDCRST_MAG59-868 [uncultured Thermomicrobiales bacterium]